MLKNKKVDNETLNLRFSVIITAIIIILIGLRVAGVINFQDESLYKFIFGAIVVAGGFVGLRTWIRVFKNRY